MPTHRHLLLAVTLDLPAWADARGLEARVQAEVLPLLGLLEAAPWARLALTFGGHLLDGLGRHHESALLRLRALAEAGRVEVLGGLFYGGPIALLPERDVRCQVQMASEFWESFLGAPPAGFWVAPAGWPAELPRLFDETGLRYGLVDRDALPAPGVGAAGVRPPVVSVRRGEHRLTALCASSPLAAAFGQATPPAWLAQASQLAASQAGLAVAWLPAAQLLAGAGPARDTWQALSEGALELVLPGAWLGDGAPTKSSTAAAGLSVAAPLAASACGAAAGGPDAQVAASPQLANLVARMLRASARLRDAIGLMEDEAMEEHWSDGLATAQRLVFAAQAPDAFNTASGDDGGQRLAIAAAWRQLMAAEQLIALTLARAPSPPSPPSPPPPPQQQQQPAGAAPSLEQTLGPSFQVADVPADISAARALTEAAPLQVDHGDLDGDGVAETWIDSPAVGLWMHSPAEPSLWLRILEDRHRKVELMAALGGISSPQLTVPGMQQGWWGAGAPGRQLMLPRQSWAGVGAELDDPIVHQVAELGGDGAPARQIWRQLRVGRLRPEIEMGFRAAAGAPLGWRMCLPWDGRVEVQVDGASMLPGQARAGACEMSFAYAPGAATSLSFTPTVNICLRPADASRPGYCEMWTEPGETSEVELIWRLPCPDLLHRPPHAAEPSEVAGQGGPLAPRGTSCVRLSP